MCASVQGEEERGYMLNDRKHHLTYTASRHMYGRNFGDSMSGSVCHTCMYICVYVEYVECVVCRDL